MTVYQRADRIGFQGFFTSNVQKNSSSTPKRYTHLKLDSKRYFSAKARYFFSAISNFFGGLKRLCQGKRFNNYLPGDLSLCNLSDHEKSRYSTILMRSGFNEASSPRVSLFFESDAGAKEFINNTVIHDLKQKLSSLGNASNTNSNMGQMHSFVQNKDHLTNNHLLSTESESLTEFQKILYEIPLSTCISGLFSNESHKVSIVIDSWNKKIYLVDSKGTAPENLFFMNPFQNRENYSVMQFIDQLLKSHEGFKEYTVEVTPAFQKVGDCSAASECVVRALANNLLNSNDKPFSLSQAVHDVTDHYGDTVDKMRLAVQNRPRCLDKLIIDNYKESDYYDENGCRIDDDGDV